ncbi:hypothetical protein FLAG1_06922 [Fusarium langsethiae]|uniref:Uncharacterized protein n=1 Tax=Fusarium langsethiae TaxID=179993 RepID=A0A0M9EV24_FUSLA|nr:hypothetical protein FLAG1_06922 [Fusarium langsethiae]GKU02244.1 unnamed protein product [Fusarium langsethiae]GKU15982.1 unnamed protein product [Fusarium langsethiae]
MDSADSPPQEAQASGQKQPELRSLMLPLHIYDVSSIQEALLYGASATTNPSETVNGTAASSARLKALKDMIVGFDSIMGTPSRIPSKL